MMKKDLRTEREFHRREENKKSILKVAEKIFAQKGYSLATMDEIAEETQFSKATLYQYFKNKSEMFFEIIYKTFEEVLQKIQKVQKAEMSATEKLKKGIYCIGSHYHTKKNISRIFIMEKALMKKLLYPDSKQQNTPSSSHPPVPKRFKSALEDIFDVMCEIIREGVTAGEFRKVDPRQASVILGAMIRGYHFRGPVPDGELSVQESTDLLYDFFLHGIKKDRNE
ncbi:MAG: TetR/AcrR family transcriptional regulator [Candidatus Aminicenantes bacterium]